MLNFDSVINLIRMAESTHIPLSNIDLCIAFIKTFSNLRREQRGSVFLLAFFFLTVSSEPYHLKGARQNMPK